VTQKFFCYVDETGQDTQGEIFVVSVVIAGQEKDQLIQVCEAIERESGKGRVKWIKTTYRRRLAYIRQVLERPIFRDKLNFAIYHNTRDYLSLTVQTIGQSLSVTEETDYKATILVDGLPRTQERAIGSQLRQLGIRVRKVRGVKKDENDALIRLADAICGFIRAAHEGQPAMLELFRQGIQTGWLRNLSPK
jgi:hypothetical protein